MTTRKDPNPAPGFSLLELLIVISITLVVAAIAIPQALTAIQDFKLRSTVSSVSGTVQRARMLAVARNNYYPVLCAASYAPCTTPPTGSSGTYTYIGTAGDIAGTSLIGAATTEKVTVLAGNVAYDTSGANPSDATILNGLIAAYSLPKFNPRGLPCFVTAGACTPDVSKMYIIFLRQDRLIGTPGWAAINVTPAGRVQVWTWDGVRWE